MSDPRRLLPHLIVRATVALAIVAVLIGRGAGGPTGYSPSPRGDPVPPRYHAFNGVLFSDHPFTPRLLDTETGAVSLLEIPGARGFETLGVSPWRDASGQHHLAGCWRGFANDEHQGFLGVAGVARGTFPRGQILDRIVIDPVLVAPPCWFPDGSDRILFAGGDGRLYVLNFLEASGPDGAASAARPQPVRWATAHPGSDAIHIREPCWPVGPVLGGRLIVAIYTSRDRRYAPLAPLKSRLWWLQLSPDATEVVAAGRLIDPGGNAIAEEDDEFLPTVGTTRDGLPLLAYVVSIRSQSTFELRTAPISMEGELRDGIPRVQAGSARRLASVGVLALPAFSPDGQWIYTAVRARPDGEVRIERFAAAPAEQHGTLAE